MEKIRYYQLDWLRLIAFGILIYFHAAIIFIPGGLPLIQNNETSELADKLVNFSHQFRLGLLFLISGAGVAFAFKNKRDFMIERSMRLLIPLVVGIFILVPLAVYFERLHLGQFTGNFYSFYPSIFTNGVYPQGNLSWHHFWFIAYLFIFCLLSLPYLSWCKTFSGQCFLDKLNHLFSGTKIFLIILILLLPEIPLRAIFPGFRDLIHDWASFTHWLILFLAGTVIAHRPNILRSIGNIRFLSLTIASISTYFLFCLYYKSGYLGIDLNGDKVIFNYILFCVLRIIMIWSCLLSCIGFAEKHLQFNNKILEYLNRAIYPLFILHLTLIAGFGYLVTPLPWTMVVKYFVITSATIATAMLIYQFFIRPFYYSRLLFGLKN